MLRLSLFIIALVVLLGNILRLLEIIAVSKQAELVFNILLVIMIIMIYVIGKKTGRRNKD
ncbi:hypothetical protein MHTCC0001_16020 [Flavobacteriaceae bacterium MHTCC 0001]